MSHPDGLSATIRRSHDDTFFFELWIADGFESIASPENEAHGDELRRICLDDRTYDRICALAPNELLRVRVKLILPTNT